MVKNKNIIMSSGFAINAYFKEDRKDIIYPENRCEKLLVASNSIGNVESYVFISNRSMKVQEGDGSAIDEKMQRNFLKAISEHQMKRPLDNIAFVTMIESSLSLFEPSETPQGFECASFSLKGPRHYMEDTNFVLQDDKCVLAGVFDGHGGKVVSRLAKEEFQKIFFQKLEENSQNVRLSFDQTIDVLHERVVSMAEANPDLYRVGSTAVVSYIDKETNNIYTATLGDSEANIYRKLDKEIKSFPLSCVRDWSSDKDAKRASEALEDPKIAKTWSKAKKPKKLRLGFNPRNIGDTTRYNVARAIGDIDSTKAPNGKPGIIHKPKITMYKVKKSDILIIASDGLKDSVFEKEMRFLISNIEKAPIKEIAFILADYAVNERKANDNVTVVAIRVL